MSQATANLAWAETLLASLASLGLREVIASPGGRSTPLVLAAHRHPQLTLRIVTDERVAAFTALGIARGSARPVALVATSGSAGGHWLPALVEARASQIGLLALTANRPHELLGCGAPQAVPQRHFFTDQVGLARAIPAPSSQPSQAELRSLETLALAAWRVASGEDALPVHLDLAFRAPLWAPPGAKSETPLPGPAPVRRAPPRLLSGTRRLTRAAVSALARELSAVERGVIFCGPDAGGASPAAAAAFAPVVRELARALGWPLICDAASGLRSPG
ncbi:MAG: 2-succinyl-5-enolpyruvyl-6-hydroxy-3-cyclohexene-1-carboxylate synthase, partial [Planctomycetes bacterium]|nr:2-succinyl-5-enolpyruvyl-6-hydroxy-3-cyclohexene-1-carboxylate synthase [Planctomycetota bacterium]